MNGEEKPRQRRSDAFINRLLETHFPTLFHTASALSAPLGHLPLEGKALGVGQRYSRFAAFSMARRILDCSLLPLEGGVPKGRRLAPVAG